MLMPTCQARLHHVPVPVSTFFSCFSTPPFFFSTHPPSEIPLFIAATALDIRDMECWFHCGFGFGYFSSEAWRQLVGNDG
jgi:hypothetical protein